jgi:RNA recognition motif-containing protein
MASPGNAGNNNNPTPPSTAAADYMARYDLDRKSIFIGNLPIGTDEKTVRSIFGEHGYINDVFIKETASRYDCEFYQPPVGKYF